MLDELLHPDRDRPWSDRDGETLGDLEARARRIAARIAPGSRRVVLSCQYARSFLPGLLGAWLAGATVELLPNVQAGTLDRVDGDPAIAYVLHDRAERRGRTAKAIYLPDLEGPHGTDAADAHGESAALAWPEPAGRPSTSGATEAPRS